MIFCFCGGGLVLVEGYGGGGTFDPIKILPFKEGKALANSLRALKAAHAVHLKGVTEHFKVQLAEILAPFKFPEAP